MFVYLYVSKDPGKLPWIQGLYKHRRTIEIKFLTISMYLGFAGNLSAFPDLYNEFEKNILK